MEAPLAFGNGSIPTARRDRAAPADSTCEKCQGLFPGTSVLPPSSAARRGYGLAAGSCSIGIAEPDTCGIWPFQRFVISYDTRFGVMLSARRRLALACASASVRIALALPAALIESPCAWN